MWGTGLAVQDELGGLPAALERAGHHADDGHFRQPVAGGCRLVAAHRIKFDAGCPASQ